MRSGQVLRRSEAEEVGCPTERGERDRALERSYMGQGVGARIGTASGRATEGLKKGRMAVGEHIEPVDLKQKAPTVIAGQDEIETRKKGQRQKWGQKRAKKWGHAVVLS